MQLYDFIGSAVRQRRAELGKTQEDLATSSGLKRSSIANLETGRQQVPLEDLIAIARALRTDYRTFLPTPAQLPDAVRGPVTAETVRERAPTTAELIQRFQTTDADDEPTPPGETEHRSRGPRR